jgi:hypothetical protein
MTKSKSINGDTESTVTDPPPHRCDYCHCGHYTYYAPNNHNNTTDTNYLFVLLLLLTAV